MNNFEIVSKYEDSIELPKRATEHSAGYDLVAAKDIEIPSLFRRHMGYLNNLEAFSLEEVSKFLIALNFRPTLVPTGVKVKLETDCYLSISARSSLPLKHMLLVANSPGIVDADYYNNPDNEGEIFIQLINLSPFDIQIKKGDRIAQGIIQKYIRTADDSTTLKRTSGHGSTGTN